MSRLIQQSAGTSMRRLRLRPGRCPGVPVAKAIPPVGHAAQPGALGRPTWRDAGSPPHRDGRRMGTGYLVHRTVAPPDPIGQQGRLAEPRPGGHQDELPRQPSHAASISKGSTIVAPPDTTRSGYSSSLNCSRGSPRTPMRSAGAPSTSRPSGASPRCSPARAVAADNTSCGVSAPWPAWSMSCSSWASIPQGTSGWARSVPYSSRIPAWMSWLALPATPGAVRQRVQRAHHPHGRGRRAGDQLGRDRIAGDVGPLVHAGVQRQPGALGPAEMRGDDAAVRVGLLDDRPDHLKRGDRPWRRGAGLVPAPWCTRRATRLQGDLDQRGAAGDELADGLAGGLDIGHLQSGAGAEHGYRIAAGCGEDRPGCEYSQPPIAAGGCHQGAAGVPDRRDAVPQDRFRGDLPKQRMAMQVDEAGKQRAGEADQLAWAGELVGWCHGRDPITPDCDRVVLEDSRAVEHLIRGDDVPVAESSPCGLVLAGSHHGSSFRRALVLRGQYEPGVRGASPEGGDARWNLLRPALARRWRWIGAHRPGSCHATREPSPSHAATTASAMACRSLR